MSEAQHIPHDVDLRNRHVFRAWIMLAVVFTLALAIDLGSKAWAFRNVTLSREQLVAAGEWHAPSGSTFELLPWRILDLQLVMNFGAVFGLGEHQRFFFITFTLVALGVGVLVFSRMVRGNHRLAQCALALVMAGGVGNLYDRIQLGAVRDFLHLFPRRYMPAGWNWPGGSTEMFPWVFNVADMLLLIGMAMLMMHMRRLDRRRRAERLRHSLTTSAAVEPAPAQSTSHPSV